MGDWLYENMEKLMIVVVLLMFAFLANILIGNNTEWHAKAKECREKYGVHYTAERLNDDTFACYDEDTKDIKPLEEPKK